LYGADVRDGLSQFSEITLRMMVYGIEGRWCDWDEDERGRRVQWRGNEIKDLPKSVIRIA